MSSSTGLTQIDDQLCLSDLCAILGWLSTWTRALKTSVCRLPNGRAYRVESACPGIFGVINLTLLNENLCVCLSSVCLFVWSVCCSGFCQTISHAQNISQRCSDSCQRETSVINTCSPLSAWPKVGEQKCRHLKIVKIKDTQVSPRNTAIFSSFNRFINKSIWR